MRRSLKVQRETVVNKGTELLCAIDTILAARGLPPLTESEVVSLTPFMTEWASEMMRLYRFPEKDLVAAGLL